MDARLQKLLTEIPEDQYITAEALAEKLDMGVKTVRVRIADLNDALDGNGARVISKQHYGYMLKVSDRARYTEYVQICEQPVEGRLPTTPDERLFHILLMLINTHDFMRLDDIADALYVSKATVSNDIKRIEEILKEYKLSLLRKPHYGIKISGKERRIRRLIIEYVEQGEFRELANEKHPVSQEEVRDVLESLIKKYEIVFYHAAFEKLCLQLFITINRIARGFVTEFDNDVFEEGKTSDSILFIANEITEALGRLGNVTFSKSEFEFIILQLQGKRTIGAQQRAHENYLITEHIQNLTIKMLNSVYTEFGIDLRSDLELRLSLSMHLLPFDIRMRYGMALNNPETKDIEEHYAFAYTVASRACASIQEHYDHEIPPSEIAYITPFFVLAMEKSGKTRKKKKVLLVCSTGKASSQLLAYKFQEEFGDYIERMEVMDLFSLSEADAEEYDYIFTTVPIPFEVPRPVFEVSQFLLQDEISRVRTILSRRDEKNVGSYYKEELFFTDIGGNDRFEIISNICDRIARVYPLPTGFEEAVKKRESFFSTDYGNLVAFPHPITMMGNETFVSVTVLEKPILWERNMVQVVLTVSIAQSGDLHEQLQKFYSVTANLITDEAGIQRLIANPTYDTLLHLLE